MKPYQVKCVSQFMELITSLEVLGVGGALEIINISWKL